MTYALTFYLDPSSLLVKAQGLSVDKAYECIRNVLARSDFEWQPGNLYVGGPKVNPVHCVLAAQKLNATYPWFKSSVREFRMLRIEDMNDLMPAIET